MRRHNRKSSMLWVRAPAVAKTLEVFPVFYVGAIPGSPSSSDKSSLTALGGAGCGHKNDADCAGLTQGVRFEGEPRVDEGDVTVNDHTDWAPVWMVITVAYI